MGQDTRNDIGILAMTFNTMVEAVRRKGRKKSYLKELAEKNIEMNGLNEKLRGRTRLRSHSGAEPVKCSLQTG